MSELANRSLERGITIMEIVARRGEATLADLHRESGIPKSSIRRLLGTLVSRRILRRSLYDGRYRINITLNTGATVKVPAEAGLLVDVAIPILSEHTRRVGWPSDIQIIDGFMMRVIDSTRPLSPFHLYRGVIHRAINIFGSATGQSCLAALPDARIRDYIARARGDQRFGLGRFSVNEAAFFETIEATRERGYGIRLRQYRGETVVDDKLGAIAVPVRQHGEVPVPSACCSRAACRRRSGSPGPIWRACGRRRWRFPRISTVSTPGKGRIPEAFQRFRGVRMTGFLYTERSVGAAISAKSRL